MAASDAPTPVVFYLHGGGWGAAAVDNNKAAKGFFIGFRFCVFSFYFAAVIG